ncbi:MAG TPA: hypothetical protein VFM71_09645 [Gemmatimonadaceae bacterium]|nr:hypothetical protein [Gemmatimonadaceae bacterium]
MILRIRSLALAASFALATGCDDPFDVGAQRQTIDVSIEAWALSDAPPEYPSGFLVPQMAVVPVGSEGDFDIAFDIDETGRLVVLPVSKVVQPLAGQRRIGFIRIDEPYNTVIEAPLTGWAYDTSIVVNPGGAFLARVQTRFCQFELRQDIYAKFFVDSVIPAERRVKLVARIDPNCGYRSLLLGVPTF